MIWKGLKNHLDIGIVHGAIFPEVIMGEGPIIETLEYLIEDNYFDRIEIGHINDDKIREKVHDMFITSGIKSTFLAQPFIFQNDLDLNSFNKKKRRNSIEEIKLLLQQAHLIGSDALALASGPMVDYNIKIAKKLLEESIVELSEVAYDLGLKIYLEIYDYDVDKKRLIGKTKDALEIVSNIQKHHKNFNLMVDLSHFPLINETIEESILPLQDKIGYVHVGNCIKKPGHKLYGDKHPYIGHIDGENDINSVVQLFTMLNKVKYLQPEHKASISVEIMKGSDENSKMLIERTKSLLNDAWDIFINTANK